ncbi:MAG: orotate phosphoribosyltransferase [Candidatus Omnitrophica bacterium]|nr:orotate phosphoribosyltransferase [Candidatus Omnitrophota bacterium]
MPLQHKDKPRLLEMVKQEAYFPGKVILSSGKESDYYIDARRLTLHPEGVTLISRILLDMVKGDYPDAMGGMTLGADPLVGALGVLSFQAGRPVKTFIIRKAAKAHGRQKQVEGPDLKPGMNIVLIDDVATTGKAFLESLDVFDALGIQCRRAICVVNRDEGAKEALAARGCQLLSIFDIREIHS